MLYIIYYIFSHTYMSGCLLNALEYLSVHWIFINTLFHKNCLQEFSGSELYNIEEYFKKIAQSQLA